MGQTKPETSLTG